MFEGDLVAPLGGPARQARLGVHDHFFEIGGHSLLAARLVDAIERETGLAVPLTALFVDDTIDGLARAIREGALRRRRRRRAVNERGTRPPFVFLHGDFFGGGFYSRALARRARARPADARRASARPRRRRDPADDRGDGGRPRCALRELRPHGPYVVGGHCNGAFVAFEMARQLIAQGESVPAVIVVDAIAPARCAPRSTPTRVAAGFAEVGLPPPVDRVSDLALRLRRAMRAYRARPHRHARRLRAQRDQQRGVPRRGLGGARRHGARARVLPGDHKSLVMEGGGARFVGVVRDVIDRVAVGAGRASG